MKIGEKGTPLEDVVIVGTTEGIPEKVYIEDKVLFCEECGEKTYPGKVGSCYSCAEVYTEPDEEDGDG